MGDKDNKLSIKNILNSGKQGNTILDLDITDETRIEFYMPATPVGSLTKGGVNLPLKDYMVHFVSFSKGMKEPYYDIIKYYLTEEGDNLNNARYNHLHESALSFKGQTKKGVITIEDRIKGQKPMEVNDYYFGIGNAVVLEKDYLNDIKNYHRITGFTINPNIEVSFFLDGDNEKEYHTLDLKLVVGEDNPSYKIMKITIEE